MTRPVESTAITCPVCFETFEIVVDVSEGREQEFIYDCEICCRPIVVKLRISGDGTVSTEVDYGN